MVKLLNATSGLLLEVNTHIPIYKLILNILLLISFRTSPKIPIRQSNPRIPRQRQAPHKADGRARILLGLSWEASYQNRVTQSRE